MRDQMEKVVYVTDDFATEPTARLAKTLAEITPGDSNKRVWFGQSGAGAVEAAIKGARFYKYHQMIKKGLEKSLAGYAISLSVQDHFPVSLVAWFYNGSGLC